MMPRLKSIRVENFRSIRGDISVSLDAPVVLIHGQNGTGKTSLLSAIELALTGAIPSLAKVEPGYLMHLPHKSAPDGVGRVGIEVSGLEKATKCVLRVTQDSVEKGHLLSDALAHFFHERCYLAQSTLGRLLEIYQHQDTRRTDSPLTLFVKELLGLDSLDALIAGLHAAGDVRRLREPVPSYWSARQDLPTIGARLVELRSETNIAAEQLSNLELQLNARLRSLSSGQFTASDLSDARAFLSSNAEEPELQSMARARRDLSAIAEQWRAIAQEVIRHDGSRAESTAKDAEDKYAQWRRGDGAQLYSLLEELRTILPNHRSSESEGPEEQRSNALKSVTAELVRLNETLNRDEADDSASVDLNKSIEQGLARTKVLDSQLQEAAGQNDGLAQALATMLPHIKDNNCPVCGRDFDELFEGGLNEHVSQHISALVETAARLQALAQDKATTGATVSRNQRELAVIHARRLNKQQSDSMKSRRARFEEIANRLKSLQQVGLQGVSLLNAKFASEAVLARIRMVDSSTTSLRSNLQEILLRYKQAALGANEGIDIAATRLSKWVEEAERLLVERQAQRKAGLADIVAIETQRQKCRRLGNDLNATELREKSTQVAKTEADRRIELARELARQAREIRTDIVRRVFNDELNTVWRDLFVRLAPEEPFVPAFALPDTTTGPVEAVLETLYRAGGKGGNPLAMLSAGNLNTAALTLFLALHLSVRPSLPWLIIDDPVQSMDEVHISQFAAVLRTLAKQKNRQIIIAVHERPLFDYLALELSPAFQDDRLITVNLSRAADGTSDAVWSSKTFKPDRAIAA